MSFLIVYILVGGGVGAGLGYFGQRKPVAFPWMANWRRGALCGAALGALFALSAGRSGDAPELNQSTANVRHITEAEFDAEVRRAALPVMVDFYATWCGPCRELAPVMDGLAGQYAGKIKFVKVNVDESPKLAREFQVAGIPMLVFFQHGKPAGTSVGLVGKDDLIRALDALLVVNTNAPAPR